MDIFTRHSKCAGLSAEFLTMRTDELASCNGRQGNFTEKSLGCFQAHEL